MKNYTVVVTEYLTREVIVEAENYTDALDKVEEMWKGAELVLTADDFAEVEFREVSSGCGYYI